MCIANPKMLSFRFTRIGEPQTSSHYSINQTLDWLSNPFHVFFELFIYFHIVFKASSQIAEDIFYFRI